MEEGCGDGEFPAMDDPRLGALCRASWVLNSTHSTGAMLEALVDEAILLTGAERGFVILVPENTEEMHFPAARSAEGATLVGHRSGICSTSVRKVMLTGQPMVAHYSEQAEASGPSTSFRLLGLRSLLCLPVSSADRALGALYLDSTDLARFNGAELEVVTALAQLAGVALGRARLQAV